MLEATVIEDWLRTSFMSEMVYHIHKTYYYKEDLCDPY